VKAYLNGKFIPQDKVAISPFDRGFQFADGVYEVIRVYSGKPFKLDDHIARLERSLKELKIKVPDLNEIRNAAYQLITDNNLTDGQALVYIQVTRGVFSPRRHEFPPAHVQPTVHISTSVFSPHLEEVKNGVKVILEDDIRWARCDIKSIALLPNVLGREKAIENNAYETVWVRDGFIMEGTHTNFCGIKNGELVTPSLSNFILAGITRKVVLQICDGLGIPVQEEPINQKYVEAFDECMIVGTTVEVTPVIQIDNWQVGNGIPGPFTNKIQKEFYKLAIPDENIIEDWKD
jgi:D-alanine transaminase